MHLITFFILILLHTVSTFGMHDLLYILSWSHSQAQMGNGIQLGFSIDITLRKDT